MWWVYNLTYSLRGGLWYKNMHLVVRMKLCTLNVSIEMDRKKGLRTIKRVLYMHLLVNRGGGEGFLGSFTQKRTHSLTGNEHGLSITTRSLSRYSILMECSNTGVSCLISRVFVVYIMWAQRKKKKQHKSKYKKTNSNYFIHFETIVEILSCKYCI